MPPMATSSPENAENCEETEESDSGTRFVSVVCCLECDKKLSSAVSTSLPSGREEYTDVTLWRTGQSTPLQKPLYLVG